MHLILHCWHLAVSATKSEGYGALWFEGLATVAITPRVGGSHLNRSEISIYSCFGGHDAQTRFIFNHIETTFIQTL